MIYWWRCEVWSEVSWVRSEGLGQQGGNTMYSFLNISIPPKTQDIHINTFGFSFVLILKVSFIFFRSDIVL